MAKICDRSPCDSLLEAMGVWIFFDPAEGFIMAARHNEDITIDYCPFCGTRLEEVGPTVIDRYTRPKRRRRPTRLPIAS